PFVSGSCHASNNRRLANGGQGVCGPTDVHGGRGGGNRCPPSFNDQYSGLAGVAGSGGTVGGGGAAGYDSDLTTNGTICIVPSGPMNGTDGAGGEPGIDGSPVMGCTSPVGAVIGGHWIGL